MQTDAIHESTKNRRSAHMLVYSSFFSARLQYIIHFIGQQLFEKPIETTDDVGKFISYDGPKLNYSDAEVTDAEFYMQPVSLLFENGIRVQQIECFELNYHKAFFQTKGDFSFDIFAASFYLLSRYEEYLPNEKDEYGRYKHTDSLAFREGFLNVPLVNIWLKDFRQALIRKFPDLRFRYNSFTFIPTYDIDIAYAYLNKGVKRNLGGLVRNIFRGDWASVLERIKVLTKKKADPYDVYEWLDSVHLYCRLKPIYFFLAAQRRRKYDKNISIRNKNFQDLIQYHGAGYTIGLHPSWQSNEEPGIISEELDWLSYIADIKIQNSRQHYIRMALPETYRLLITNKIACDHSMGYGSVNGFRASVASPFYWYDLEQERQTELQIFPFCFMDANALYEEKLSPQHAMDELLHYYNIVKKVNGVLITIWHNHILGTGHQFTGWRDVYEIFLRDEVYWDM